MSKEQKELYNSTLRTISAEAHAILKERYNAFEDSEIKEKIKFDILAGNKPKTSEIAKSVVSRVTQQRQSVKGPSKTETGTNTEILELRAELALMRAGIKPDRIDAAKKLFVAESGKIEDIGNFVDKYPEWKTQETDGVTLQKAPPVGSKTAPTPGTNPVLNDFERKVQAMRKKRGLE
jgi:hypothetical protein